MPARLLCRVGPMRGADFDLDREAMLGRHPECTVVLPVPAVSGRHARIAWDEQAGSYFLEDLGSLNGTELDGEPLSGRERLDRLHVITLGGKLDLIFQGPDLCPERSGFGRRAEPAGGTATVLDERPVELPAALEREAEGGTLIEERPVELPAAFGSPAETERTEVDLEVLPLPGAIEPPNSEATEPEATEPEAPEPEPEPPAGDRG